MAMVFPNVGELFLLDAMLAAQDLKVHLYKSEITPSATDTATTYSAHEADFVDYAAIPLTKTLWNPSTTNSAGAAQSVYSATQSWIFGTEQTVYGVYITDSTDATLIAVDPFASAQDIPAAQALNYLPTVTASSEN